MLVVVSDWEGSRVDANVCGLWRGGVGGEVCVEGGGRGVERGAQSITEKRHEAV